MRTPRTSWITSCARYARGVAWRGVPWRAVPCRAVPCLGVAWHGVARRSGPCVHARARLRLARPPDGRTHARRSAQAHERTRARASSCITHTCTSAQEVGEESGEAEAVMPMPQRPLRSCRCRAGLFGRPNAASAPLVMPMRTPYRAQRCMQHNERGKARNGSGAWACVRRAQLAAAYGPSHVWSSTAAAYSLASLTCNSCYARDRTGGS